MKWEEFLKKAINLPVIDTELFLSGVAEPEAIRVQISRWEKAEKLIQVKRGYYVLPPIYRKKELYEPYIAGVIKMPSYISLEKALEYHGLIPEGVSIYTCVTTKGTGTFFSKIGIFRYYHIKSSLFWGYEAVTVNMQTAFVALPEKALLDLFYLKDIKVTNDFIEELRLENIDKINIDRLCEFAQKFKKPAILKAAKIMSNYITSYEKGKTL